MIQKRNWKCYWWAYVLHFLSGIALVAGIFFGGIWRVFALVGLVIELFYQFVEFLKWKDTPARDVKDIKVGYYLGILVVVICAILQGSAKQPKELEPGIVHTKGVFLPWAEWQSQLWVWAVSLGWHLDKFYRVR